MRKAAAIALFAAVTFGGAATAQTNLSPRPGTPDPGPTEARPLRGPTEPPAVLRGRSGSVDLNNNSATGRTAREPGSGAMPQRLGPIAPGTGAPDRGPPDSSTYNPSAPSTR
jgi:hypothetical protein